MERRDAEVLERIGRNLRAERARKNLTQEGLAQLAGLTTSQIARMERGEIDSGVSKFVRLAVALQVEATDLFFDAVDPAVEYGGRER